ncbi:hypothetical protein KXD40_004972 [Peronospora effusa]|nr:hypothetical protein KXD40_004972 [Peronospora effusa]
MEWPPPLNVELADDEFSISNESNEILLKTASFPFATATDVSTSITEPSSSQLLSSDQAVHVMAPRAECVTKRQISSFISERGGDGGIMDWIRLYLNQCGHWSNLKLGSEAEVIHKVCMWLEKTLNGDLDATKAVTFTQRSVINVADHSLIQGVTKYPSEMMVLEKDAVILDGIFHANVTIIKEALRRDDLRPGIYDAQGQDAWKAYTCAAHSFCEERWPERSGKEGKLFKKSSRPKANAAATAAAVTFVLTNTTDVRQSTTNG